MDKEEDFHRHIAAVDKEDILVVDDWDKEDKAVQVDVKDTHLPNLQLEQHVPQLLLEQMIAVVVNDVALHRVAAMKIHSMRAFLPVVVTDLL